jgi:hypothetical protein
MSWFAMLHVVFGVYTIEKMKKLLQADIVFLLRWWNPCSKAHEVVKYRSKAHAPVFQHYGVNKLECLFLLFYATLDGPSLAQRYATVPIGINRVDTNRT